MIKTKTLDEIKNSMFGIFTENGYNVKDSSFTTLFVETLASTIHNIGYNVESVNNNMNGDSYESWFIFCKHTNGRGGMET